MKKVSVLFLGLIVSVALNAQDGNAGINEANTKVRSYFNSGTNLMYAVASSELPFTRPAPTDHRKGSMDRLELTSKPFPLIVIRM